LVMVTSIRNRQSGEIDQFFTRSKRHHVLNNSEIDEVINIIFDELRTKFSTFIARSTNVEVLKIVRLDMHIDRYETVRGSGYVPLPDWINRKKATVSIQNRDDRCFLYAVESALQDSVSTNPAFYSRSIQRYGYASRWFDMMPMGLGDIKLFEEEFDISINVYEPIGVDQVRPMRLSTFEGSNHVDLMLYKRHYSRIVDLSRLLSKQINNNTRKKFICKRCLNHFYTQ